MSLNTTKLEDLSLKQAEKHIESTEWQVQIDTNLEKG